MRNRIAMALMIPGILSLILILIVVSIFFYENVGLLGLIIIGSIFSGLIGVCIYEEE